MRKLFIGFVLWAVLLTACNMESSQPGNTNPLTLTLKITPRAVYSIDDIQSDYPVKSRGDADLLVHRCLLSLPFSAPPL